MSDDLISRKALLDIFNRNSIFECITNAEGKNVIEIIKERPTAYDMDMVVKKLQESNFSEDWTNDVVYTDDAIEIVKSGGVADE